MGRCNVAVVLAAGRGSRMKSDIPKQYMMLEGKPLICHCLEVLEKSTVIDQVVLVTGSGETSYMKETIVERYGYQKVTVVIEGGSERYLSVYCALEHLAQRSMRCDYVFIHDGVRPYLEEELLGRLYDAVQQEGACIAAVPVKDTIKRVDENGRIAETPKRSSLWAAQTPQVFKYTLIYDAYSRMLSERCVDGITDDAQVMERMCGRGPVIVEGSYRNIKITTPEDIK